MQRINNNPLGTLLPILPILTILPIIKGEITMKQSKFEVYITKDVKEYVMSQIELIEKQNNIKVSRSSYINSLILEKMKKKDND